MSKRRRDAVDSIGARSAAEAEEISPASASHLGSDVDVHAAEDRARIQLHRIAQRSAPVSMDFSSGNASKLNAAALISAAAAGLVPTDRHLASLMREIEDQWTPAADGAPSPAAGAAAASSSQLLDRHLSPVMREYEAPVAHLAAPAISYVPSSRFVTSASVVATPLQSSTSPSPSVLRVFSKKNFEFESKRLGHGGCGAVYKANLSWDTEGLSLSANHGLAEAVAVKKILTRDKRDDLLMQSLREEALWQSQLAHPNVLPLRGVIDDEETGEFLLVMDLMGGGSLCQLLKERGASLSFNERMKLSQQCARAVQYLHTLPNPILHTDIKSHNFLVDNGTVKLGQPTSDATEASGDYLERT
jgi:hypothetical protein